MGTTRAAGAPRALAALALALAAGRPAAAPVAGAAPPHPPGAPSQPGPPSPPEPGAPEPSQPGAQPPAPASPPAFRRPIRFELRAPRAREVVLVGLPPAGAPLKLRRGDDGRFYAVLPLEPGRYGYVFRVDGEVVLDPAADEEEPDGAGGRRSVVLVRPDDVDARPRPDVPHGRLSRELRRSAVLAGRAPFRLWLPPGVAPRGLPVLLLLHGQGMTEDQWVDAGIANLLDNLLAQGRIAPFAVVMPGTGPAGYGAATERDLAEELLPHLARAYGLDTGAGRVGVAGLSSGGLAAVRLAWRYPDAFALAEALSPAAPDLDALDRLDGELARRPTAAAVVIRCGRQDPIALPTCERLVQLLAARGAPPEQAFTRGEHDWTYWQGAAPLLLEDASRRLGAGR